MGSVESLVKRGGGTERNAQVPTSRVGELLLRQGLIAEGDLRLAQSRLREAGGALTTHIVRQCDITEADLLTALQEGKSPMLNGRDNLKTIALVDAAGRSSREQRRVRLDSI